MTIPKIEKTIKKPRQKEKYIRHSKPIFNLKNDIHNQHNRKLEYTEDGKLTFIGVYRKVINEIQNDRMWVRSTCRQYDNYVCKYIVKYFDKTKPFSFFSYDDISFVIEDLQQKNFGKNKKDATQRLIRLIVQKAYDLGLTDILPDAEDDDADGSEIRDEEDDYPDKDESQEEKRQGRDNADLIVYKPRSLSLADSLNVCCYLISKADTNGEAIGGLIMITTGERTSESAGFMIKDYVSVGDRKMIARISVMDQTRSTIALGGKTTNAYRYIPIPLFLQKILDDRIEMLSERFGANAVLKFPMICSGTNYKVPATQKEINAIMKEAFHVCRVNENVEKAAMEFFCRDADVQAESGGELTAYIGRHQFVSDSFATGIPIEFLQLSAGHKVTDLYSKREDQSNPDLLKVITEYLDNRPLVRILNGEMDNIISLEAESEPVIFSGDDLSITLKKGNTYGVLITSYEPGDHPSVKCSAAQIKHSMTMPALPNVQRGIFNRKILLPEIRAGLFSDGFCAQEEIVDAATVYKPLDLSALLELSTNMDQQKDVLTMRETEDPSESRLTDETESYSQTDIFTQKPIKFADLSDVYVVAKSGNEINLHKIPEKFGLVGEYGSKGAYLHLNGEPMGLLRIQLSNYFFVPAYDSTFMFRLDRVDGRLKLYGPPLDVDFSQLDPSIIMAVKKNDKSKGLIVLNSDGELHIHNDISHDTQMICLDSQETGITDALYTCRRYSKKDILIGTKNGFGLRVSQSEICDNKKHMKKSVISTSDSDAPSFILHYPDKKEEIIAISESGALCKRGDDILQRQSLIKQGQRILPQGEKWVKAIESNPGDALLLLSCDGKVLCLDTSELSKTSINDSEKKPGMVGALIRAAVCVPMLTGG